ncbi:MAG TPA: four helix bundle protein, partial [Balneolaceae bacterium]|nr:four helix bundle protein [Balneolaceae bacterium]
MSYKNLKIWQSARKLSIEIHKMTMKLPRFEFYEVGSQIRRSSKSIRSNIVEGYGRRRYKSDFIKFLVFAHSSTDETRDHLDTLFETGSLIDKKYLRKNRSNRKNDIQVYPKHRMPGHLNCLRLAP